MLHLHRILYLQRRASVPGGGERRVRGLADALGARLEVRALRSRWWEPLPGDGGGWDLALKTAERRRGVPPWRLHPDDRDLLEHSPCPVWLLHPTQGGTARSVVAAVGVAGPPDSPGDATVLRTAALLSRRLGAELTVVRPWSRLGNSILASPLRGVSRRRYRRLLRETQTELHEESLRILASRIPLVPADLVVRMGSPETVIRSVARRCDADVLVLGEAGAEALQDRLRGPLPERLFRTVPTALLHTSPGDPRP
ncbi:MAG: universal stress protein [Longimicrobiales bacterium]|nr:universal stress protein [Longimicrobiales bacterium]